MQIEVHVGGWEHGCCGASIGLGDDVAWDVWRSGGVYRETHHVPEPGMVRISGRVIHIDARFAGDARVAVERVPSGNALNGFASDDSAELVAVGSGDLVGALAEGFVVRLELAGDATLPR